MAERAAGSGGPARAAHGRPARPARRSYVLCKASTSWHALPATEAADGPVGRAYGGDAGFGDTGYGMGWWVDRETGRISDGGAWGAVPWLDLDDGYGAYVIVEDDSSTGQALKDEIEELVHTAVTGA